MSRNPITGIGGCCARTSAKTLGLLHELVPKAVIIGLLVNPSNPEVERKVTTMEEAARTLDLQIQIIRASTVNEIDNAFPILIERGVGALIVIADLASSVYRQQAFCVHYGSSVCLLNTSPVGLCL